MNMTRTLITDPKETISVWIYDIDETTSDRAGHAGLEKDYELITQHVMNSIADMDCATFSIRTNLVHTEVTDTFTCAQELIVETNKLLTKLSDIIKVPKYIVGYITDGIASLEKLYSARHQEREPDDGKSRMSIAVIFDSVDSDYDREEDQISFTVDIQLMHDDGSGTFASEFEDKVLATNNVKFTAKILETVEA